MKAKIKQLDRLLLAGMSFFGDPFEASSPWTEENQIGRLWRRLMVYYEAQKGKIAWSGDPSASYEVHIHTPETEAQGLFEVFVGFKVSEIALVPVDLVVKVLPGAAYAVFNLKGSAITSDWEQGVSDWMAENGYREAYGFNFQYYDQRFKGMDRIAQSEIDVYIPIQKA
jgi:predicted transcriptional regulator YdeE